MRARIGRLRLEGGAARDACGAAFCGLEHEAMHYSTIKYCDIANGEGVRTVLFVSGCRMRCPFCFNEEAWNFHAGNPFDAAIQDQIVESLRPLYVDGLSVLGGEPMEPENQAGLVDFLERVRREFPDKTIWLYSGHTFENLTRGSGHTECTDRIMATLDVLVDGPFVQAKKSMGLRFRGSSNQRVIDVPATLASGEVVLWGDDALYTTREMKRSF